MTYDAETLQSYIQRAIPFVSNFDGISFSISAHEELRAAGDDVSALLRLAGRLQSRVETIEAYEDTGEAPTL